MPFQAAENALSRRPLAPSVECLILFRLAEIVAVYAIPVVVFVADAIVVLSRILLNTLTAVNENVLPDDLCGTV